MPPVAEAPIVKRAKAGRFRLLHGIHIETGCDGKEHTYKATQGHQPPEFDSPSDLTLLNGVGMSAKFEQVVEGMSPGQVRPLTPVSREKLNRLQMKAIESMTLPELQKFAAEEEIDLSNAKTKDEAIATVKAVYA